jgi:hypothetical protein
VERNERNHAIEAVVPQEVAISFIADENAIRYLLYPNLRLLGSAAKAIQTQLTPATVLACSRANSSPKSVP